MSDRGLETPEKKYVNITNTNNVHPLLALKISRKKLVRVYNVHGLLKKIVVGNVRIKYQSYIFFQDFAQILYLVGGVRIINRNNVFHSFPDFKSITQHPDDKSII
jgi:hypothetical protein